MQWSQSLLKTNNFKNRRASGLSLLLHFLFVKKYTAA